MLKFFRLSVCLAAALMLFASCASAASRCPELDAAFSMLEEGNPILESYNTLTGAQIVPRTPNGCPYFFGGSNVDVVGKTMKAWVSSTYYKEGQWYPGGLDCVGFTRWVLSESGRTQHPSLSALMGERGKPFQIPMTDGQPVLILPEFLKIGDLLVIRHQSGGYHVLMYIGTLRGFGFTETGVSPALQSRLDYPLVIHCSSNRDYSERYMLWVRQNANWANTTDGGVMVSLLGCTDEGCNGVMNNLDKTSLAYFDLDGYHLTVYTPEEGEQTRWIRWR